MFIFLEILILRFTCRMLINLKLWLGSGIIFLVDWLAISSYRKKPDRSRKPVFVVFNKLRRSISNWWLFIFINVPLLEWNYITFWMNFTLRSRRRLSSCWFIMICFKGYTHVIFFCKYLVVKNSQISFFKCKIEVKKWSENSNTRILVYLNIKNLRKYCKNFKLTTKYENCWILVGTYVVEIIRINIKIGENFVAKNSHKTLGLSNCRKSPKIVKNNMYKNPLKCEKKHENCQK